VTGRPFDGGEELHATLATAAASQTKAAGSALDRGLFRGADRVGDVSDIDEDERQSTAPNIGVVEGRFRSAGRHSQASNVSNCME